MIVFNRTVRAAAWADLMTRVLDVRDTATGAGQVRVAGGGASDGVWMVRPDAGGGAATVMGHRGPVWFQLKVTGDTPGASRPEEQLDLSARAEALAREAAADWTGWLEAHLADGMRRVLDLAVASLILGLGSVVLLPLGLVLRMRAAVRPTADRLSRHGSDRPGLPAQRHQPVSRTRVQRLRWLLRAALERALSRRRLAVDSA